MTWNTPGRPNATQRGYNWTHQKLRRQWAQRINTGHQPTCPRCGQPITHHTPWELGHTDDRTTHTGPEHKTCNQQAGHQLGQTNRKKNKQQNKQKHPGIIT